MGYFLPHPSISWWATSSQLRQDLFFQQLRRGPHEEDFNDAIDAGHFLHLPDIGNVVPLLGGSSHLVSGL